MFNTLRRNLIGKFLILSLSVYIVLSVTSAFFFHNGLTQSLDEQLQEIYAVILPAIEVEGDGSLNLRDPPRQLRVAKNFMVSPTVSLFDDKKQLTIQHGPKGSPVLLRTGTEAPFGTIHLRTFVQPIFAEGERVGFIQIQLSTAHREQAIREFLQAICATFPLLLLALACSGYVFASRAIKPIQETFDLHRRFMSDAGHELKTPLASIQASCDNLLAELEDDQIACDRVEVISRASERMQRLVSDLLLLTKSEQSAGLSLKVEPLRFDMLLREVIGEFSDRFEDKGIELVAEDLQKSSINGDRDSLHRMAANLVENAFHYTESGGRVTVSLTAAAGHYLFRVEDSGVGIPQEAMGNIFDRFYRVDESRSRAAGGAGLGLSIVKAIIESHGGQISVKSERGRGTEFTVLLPAAGHGGKFS